MFLQNLQRPNTSYIKHDDTCYSETGPFSARLGPKSIKNNSLLLGENENERNFFESDFSNNKSDVSSNNVGTESRVQGPHLNLYSEKNFLRRSFESKNENNLNLNNSQNDLVDLLSVRSMTYVQYYFKLYELIFFIDKICHLILIYFIHII